MNPESDIRLRPPRRLYRRVIRAGDFMRYQRRGAMPDQQDRRDRRR